MNIEEALDETSICKFELKFKDTCSTHTHAHAHAHTHAHAHAHYLTCSSKFRYDYNRNIKQRNHMIPFH